LDADCIIFPELALTGYPPEDLLLRPSFIRQVTAGINILLEKIAGIDVIVGYPRAQEGSLYNSAAVIREGSMIAVYDKHLLPNYSVFDEKRYFSAGSSSCVVDIKGVPVGITICEDIWQPHPLKLCCEAGARLVVNLNASPFHINKGQERETVVRQRINECGIPIVYVNLVGGQDELVFDGESFVMDAAGQTVYRARALEEVLVPVDFNYQIDSGNVEVVSGEVAPFLPHEAGIYNALVLGVRDYIEKNNFAGIVVGLSGGIDSALTLVLAVDAIGAEKVEAVLMPSRYTADMSVEDARLECEHLQVSYQVIPIEPVFKAFLSTLETEFAGLPGDTTEENIQARCRGIIMMAISNKKGKMVLTTGNKSEMAVGYATLYGDMAGGFAPIKDVPKTLVYSLSAYRNEIAPVIPQRVLERAPSAELAPDQKDEDSLPPYEVLDPILEMYIEQDLGPEEIIRAGFDDVTVRQIILMVNRNEYKRRQAPPGVRISQRAFGRDRRYPITCGFSESSN